MTTDPRAELARNWWSKALESIESAKRELDAGSCSFSVNRLYYSAFYAVTAALLERNLSFKRHSGARRAFHHEFIKSGLLDPKWGRVYDQLFEDRQEGDYLADISFSREYVESQLAICTEFLSVLRGQINYLRENSL